MQKAPKGRNLAGIIPVSGKKDTFGFPWPDCLQPLREGMLAIERSVLECALAGCDSIWVIINDDTAPLVKSRIGDYVMDPRYFEQKDFVRNKAYHEKWIPIYYTPVMQKDRDKRDSLGWSVLHGALTSYVVANKISKWSRPTKYFVSFPYGVYKTDIVKKHRAEIRGNNSFYLSHKGETVKDGKCLGFTFFPEDWIKYKRNVKKSCTGGSKNIPISERWSSRFFTLDKIFNVDIITIDNRVEIPEYYELNDWQALEGFYRSEMKLSRPSRQFMKPYIFEKEVENV